MEDPKAINKLQIFKAGQLAGTLERTSYGSRFDFAPSFLEDPKQHSLSYMIKKEESSIEIRGNQLNLHPFFAGIIPQGETFLKDENDLFSLFAALTLLNPDHCIGDVFGHTTAPASLNLTCSMIKINSKDRPNLVQNEYQSFLLAKKCGLEINKIKLVKTKLNTLLVERFDRIYHAPTKSIFMVHQEDAYQFLNNYPTEKYRPSLMEIVRGMRQILDASDWELETLNLLRQYAFSYLIGNGEFHAKNVSLQTDYFSQKITMSKASNVLTTAIYGNDQMDLKLWEESGDKSSQDINRQALIDFAHCWQISEKVIKGMLDKLLYRIVRNRCLLEEIPMQKKTLKFLINLIDERIMDLA